MIYFLTKLIGSLSHIFNLVVANLNIFGERKDLTFVLLYYTKICFFWTLLLAQTQNSVMYPYGPVEGRCAPQFALFALSNLGWHKLQ